MSLYFSRAFTGLSLKQVYLLRNLFSDFVKNTEAALNVNNNSSQSDEPSVIATSHGTAAPISSFGLIIRSLKGWFRRLFGTRKAREPHN